MHTSDARDPGGISLLRAASGFAVSATLLVILMVGLAALERVGLKCRESLSYSDPYATALTIS